MDYIFDVLRKHSDEKFADFQAKLIPTVERKSIIGVRTPEIRALAKQLRADGEFCKNVLPAFLKELPHTYFDESVLHGELISLEKDFEVTLNLIEEFLPYIDNWAVCDILSPKVFAKHKSELFERICVWLKSDEVYTVRFGLDMLIKHFLDGEFEVSHLEMVRVANGDDYYIKMAKAWYYSFAFIKHYDETLEYFKTAPIDKWIFKKSIQKSKESFRISEEQKNELKELLKHE
ncbi:MAG: DNA alkylation repair protein [Clostridia bacterium]|nr:DNA alkylation repair protein [Clostridia bacterium]